MNEQQIIQQAKNPFCLNKDEKENYLTQVLLDRTRHHIKYCDPYRRMMNNMGFEVDLAKSYLDIPMLPVRMFKELNLMSVSAEKVKKIMTSSGTTGQHVSKIFLDEENIRNQSAVLTVLTSRSFTTQNTFAGVHICV